MSGDHLDPTRRALLLAAAGLALPGPALAGGDAPAAPPAPAAGRAPSPALAAVAPGDGRPGQFDFLAGHWTIANRRLLPDGKTWDEFPGEATCHTVLGGAGSVEDLRIPARKFAGLGLRLLDQERKVWTDHFVSARTGVLAPPPTDGRLADGVFTFVAQEQDGGTAVLYRGVWDRITPTSCRWHQSSSRDGGTTWAWDWWMDWTRT